MLEQLGLNQKLLIDKPIILTDFYTSNEKFQNLESSNTEFNTELVIILFRKIIPKKLLAHSESNQEEIENLNTFRVLPQMELINEFLMVFKFFALVGVLTYKPPQFLLIRL